MDSIEYHKKYYEMEIIKDFGISANAKYKQFVALLRNILKVLEEIRHFSQKHLWSRRQANVSGESFICILWVVLALDSLKELC